MRLHAQQVEIIHKNIVVYIVKSKWVCESFIKIKILIEVHADMKHDKMGSKLVKN